MAGTGGFIKLHRKMRTWRWYSTPATFTLFVHLLLMAEYTGGALDSLRAGQVLASRAELCGETGLTQKQVRTALHHLVESGEIRVESKARQRMVLTIVNWLKYQPRTQEGPSLGPSLGPRMGPSADAAKTLGFQQKSGAADGEGAKNGAKNGAKFGAKIDDEGPRRGTVRALEPQGIADAEDAEGAKPKKYKNIEEDKNNTHTKRAWAEFVEMTQAEYDSLVAEYGEAFTRACIEKLNLYKGSTGKTYASDYFTIRSWVVRRVREEQQRARGGEPLIQREYVEDKALPQWMTDMMNEEDRQKGAG